MTRLPLRDLAPFRLIVGGEDLSFLLADSFSFSSKDPGGFEAASFSVPRDLPQTLRGTPVLLTSGLSTAFEGRVSQIQRSLGSRTQIQCEGYGALLSDDEASMVFVDRDLTRWQGPSYTRQIALYNNNFQLASAQVAADPTSSTPALAQTITDSWASPWMPVNESWYDAGPGNLVSQIFYDLPGGQQAPIGTWFELLALSSDANYSSFEISANQDALAPVSNYFHPATPQRFAVIQHYNGTTNSGVQGAQYSVFWQKLAAYGPHGLPGRGSDPVGFYPSDIAAWIIAQAPGLQLGVTQPTDASGFILPHSAYYTPVGLDQMIGDMATAAGWHWGVWPSLSPLTGNPTPRCDFRPRPDPGQFSGFCLRRDTSLCDVREDLSQQYNRAAVSFTNVDGTAGVAIVTAENPILDQAGIGSRTLILSGGTMTQATAALYGAQALALTYATARVAGSIQVDQAIDGPSGPAAAWLLKPGIDQIRVGDLPSFDAWGAYNNLPVTRMEFSGSSSGFSTSLEVGTGADLVETLNARLASASFLAAQGG